MDLYGILGVSKDATQSEIKKAYRKLAAEQHPDHGGDPDAFKFITLAGEVLTDPEKRSRYDASGAIDNKQNEMVASFVASIVLDSFTQDYRDPIKVMTDRIARTRSDHEKTIQELKGGISKLTKKMHSFAKSNATTKNVVARDLILEVLRGHIELCEAQIEDSKSKAAFGTEVLAFLNDLKCPPETFNNHPRPFSSGGFEMQLIYGDGDK